MQIRIIGKPRIVGDDTLARSVPGQQAWLLLARLLMADRPLSRRSLAAEIFCEADDPLGALRWCLAALRRALGADTLRGDPVLLNLPEGVDVDVWKTDPADLVDVDPGEFLEGIEPTASAEMSTWLLIAREQIAGRLHEAYRRSAIDALARADARAAVRHAERAVRLRPLDESGHVLLVKALAASGSFESATAHIEATERDFEKQLGEKPSRALRQAARRTVADPPAGVSQAAVIDSLLKSGSAALSAGAIDAGLDCLRQAAAKAEDLGEPRLVARAFGELGAALVHSIRGFDDEGSVMLRRAADVSIAAGESTAAASALRELAYVDALAGRRPVAAAHLREAMTHAEGDADALAGAHAVAGFNLVDWGHHAEGLGQFERSLAFARESGNARRQIWAFGIGAWGQLRAGNAEAAEDWAARSLHLAEDIRWVAFLPWVQVLLVEARLAQGRLENSAHRTLDEAYSTSCQLGDPCWEAATARCKALVGASAGNHAEALEWLDYATRKCCSVTDFYAGLLVEITADRLRLHQRRGDRQGVSETARELLALAARTHADRHLQVAMEALGRA